MSEKTTEESHTAAAAEGQAAGNASVGGGINAQSQSRKSTEKRTPKKLGGRAQQEQPAEGDDSANGETGKKGGQSSITNGANDQDGDNESNDDAGGQSPTPQRQQAQKRRQSRGRGRRNNSAHESDTESIARSDLSDQGGRRNRQKQRQGKQQGKKGPLDGITEDVPGGELVNGAGDMVQDTAGQAVNTVGDTAGKALGGLTGGKDKEGGDDGKTEQLRLRLELNLDIEIQLKAKIHGDLTIGLL